MRIVQTGERLAAHFLKERALIARNRLAALALQRKLRIVRYSVDPNLEVEVRSGRPASHADITNRRSHRDARTGSHSSGKIPHVSVTAHHAVAVADVDDIAVAAFSAGEDYYPIANGA